MKKGDLTQTHHQIHIVYEQVEALTRRKDMIHCCVGQKTEDMKLSITLDVLTK